ncbi:hypothetical protein CBW57_11435 [Yersinia intermedia]|uniref:Uncharacterized protein n=1 Tax=Yersinia intermedia TaxID=631 RepID=A0A209A1K1_YERIN|nr:hypothetical protein CBW57_11435 [Yersinia intermedia]
MNALDVNVLFLNTKFDVFLMALHSNNNYTLHYFSINSIIILDTWNVIFLVVLDIIKAAFLHWISLMLANLIFIGGFLLITLI